MVLEMIVFLLFNIIGKTKNVRFYRPPSLIRVKYFTLFRHGTVRTAGRILRKLLYGASLGQGLASLFTILKNIN